MTLTVEGPAALTALLGGLENNARYVVDVDTVFDVLENGITRTMHGT
jgi:hypothetical protein